MSSETATTGTHVLVGAYVESDRWGVEVEGMWIDLGTDKSRAFRIVDWLDYGYQSLALKKPAAALEDK